MPLCAPLRTGLKIPRSSLQALLTTVALALEPSFVEQIAALPRRTIAFEGLVAALSSIQTL